MRMLIVPVVTMAAWLFGPTAPQTTGTATAPRTTAVAATAPSTVRL
jgi:hypothetical protein